MSDSTTRRKGDWMQTSTGRKFWPLDPRPEDIDIEDIAHALSMLPRYGGHCRFHYSVAQHSWLLSKYAPYFQTDPYRLWRWALLHDASEAYLVDVPRPIKPYLQGYKEAEIRLMECIAQRFGLEWPTPAAMRAIDLRIVNNEREVLMPATGEPWEQDQWGPLTHAGVNVEIEEISWREARSRFLARFYEIFPREVW